MKTKSYKLTMQSKSAPKFPQILFSINKRGNTFIFKTETDTETKTNTFKNIKSESAQELFSLEPNKQYTVFFTYIQHDISLIIIIEPFSHETIENYLDRISDLILLKINRIYEIDNHGFTILPSRNRDKIITYTI
jgi:hypothetical protein